MFFPKSSQSTKISRRNFFKSFGSHWINAFKNAHQDADFPDFFEGISFCAPAITPYKSKQLIMPRFPYSADDGKISFLIKNESENKESLLRFIKKYSIDCLFTYGNLLPVRDVCQVIYQPKTDLSPQNKPCLLLFENDEVADIIHHIPSILSQLPDKSDVYIGNIKTDLLANVASPTKKRIHQFLDDTQ